MKQTSILILVFCLAFDLSAENLFKGLKAIVKSEFIYQRQEVSFPSCHASTILETSDGLLSAWFGGTEERAPDVCIYTSVQAKGKWGVPVLTANGVWKGKQYPCWNPVLFRKDNGEIVLYYRIGPSPREWWGMYKISGDEGKTWSVAVKIPNNFLGPIKNKPIRLPDGHILYPTSVETAEKWNSYLEISDQGLKSWSRIELDNNGLQTIQPTILIHEGKKLQLLFRSKNKAIIQSWSEDVGKTWSALSPTSLPNNNSGIDAVTLKDGRHVLIFNPVTKGRNVLGMAVSVDGKNWEAAVLLENDSDSEGEYSYPAVIQAEDGLIHVVYTWKRELIKHVVIDPSKLKTKPLSNGSWPEE
jgi:predicted neuraminidase